MNGRAVKPTVVVSSARASHKALGSTCNIYVIPFNVAPHPPADYVEGIYISRALKLHWLLLPLFLPLLSPSPSRGGL